MDENEMMKLLELTDNPTKKEILKNYRRLSRIYHPDVTKQSNKKFLLLTEAKDKLIF